jgi:hypothetical protein
VLGWFEEGLKGQADVLRALFPRGQQRKQVGSVRVGVTVDIAIRRAPRAEEQQQVGGIAIAIAIEIGGAGVREDYS